MGYLCLKCYEEFNKEGLDITKHIGYNYRCPVASCGGYTVAEIDDLILPIIRELNLKGYITKYCCSGHSYQTGLNPNVYISFECGCVPEFIPKDFIIEYEDKYYDETGVCIRKFYKDNLDECELHKEICQTMVDMLEWVNKLPYRMD